MSSSTYGGVVREVPIVPFPVAALSTLKAGMVAEWNGTTHVAQAFSANTDAVLGVCTGDADLDLGIVAVYCGKGASVRILCAVGIIPNPGDLLYFSATLGSVTNVASGAAVAKAIGTGSNGYVEAVLI
jgi:glyoxylate carboligase